MPFKFSFSISNTLFKNFAIAAVATIGASLGINQLIQLKVKQVKVKWLFKRAEIYHFGGENQAQDLEKAIQFYTLIIEIAPKNPKGYHRLGSIYHNPQGDILDFEQAKTYYENALSLDKNQGEFYFSLGALWKLQEPLDVEKVYYYFFEAAQRHCMEAFPALESLLSSHPSLAGSKEFNLAALYHHPLNEMEKSIRWYLKSLALGHEQSLPRLRIIAAKNAEQAFMIGHFIEGNQLTEFANPYLFYAQAKVLHNPAAQAHLNEAIANNNPAAQYALGLIVYYQHQNDEQTAVEFCLKSASQDYKPALEFLNEAVFSPEIYSQLGKAYENGLDKTNHLAQTKNFYQKAANEDEQVRFHLSELYHRDHEYDEACNQYLKLLQYNNTKAVIALDSLNSKVETSTSQILLEDSLQSKPQKIRLLESACSAEKGTAHPITFFKTHSSNPKNTTINGFHSRKIR